MKLKKIITSIFIIILVFLCFEITPVKASFFDSDDESEIEKTINEDERRLV